VIKGKDFTNSPNLITSRKRYEKLFTNYNPETKLRHIVQTCTIKPCKTSENNGEKKERDSLFITKSKSEPRFRNRLHFIQPLISCTKRRYFRGRSPPGCAKRKENPQPDIKEKR